MILYFNKNGQLLEKLTYGTAPRVGSTNFQIFAYFDELNPNDASYTNYSVATIRLKRPDLEGSEYPDLFMTHAVITYDAYIADVSDSNFEDGVNYYGFVFDFSKVKNIEEDTYIKLLDTPGMWQASITLLNNSTGDTVTGLIEFYVEGAVSDADEDAETLDYTVIQQNIGNLLQDYALISGTIMVVSDITDSSIIWSNFNEGQLFYDKETGLYYRKINTSPYREPYDNGILGSKRTILRFIGFNEEVILSELYELANTRLTVFQIEEIEYLIKMNNDHSLIAYDFANKCWYEYNGLSYDEWSDVLSSGNKYNIASKEYVDDNVFEMTSQTMNLTDEQFEYLKTNNVRIKYRYMYFVKTIRDLDDPLWASDTWICPAITASWGGGNDYTTVKYMSITMSYTDKTLTYDENLYFNLYKKDQADEKFATKDYVNNYVNNNVFEMGDNATLTLTDEEYEFLTQNNVRIKHSNALFEHAFTATNGIDWYGLAFLIFEDMTDGIDNYTVTLFQAIKLDRTAKTLEYYGSDVSFYNKTQTQNYVNEILDLSNYFEYMPTYISSDELQAIIAKPNLRINVGGIIYEKYRQYGREYYYQRSAIQFNQTSSDYNISKGYEFVIDIDNGYITKAEKYLSVYNTTQADNRFVKAISGNQTISGVKTFNSSPIVPTPTNSTDAANKGYVDSAVSSVYKYKATKTVSEINSLTGQVIGDVYNVSNSGTLTAGNVSVVAGDNVAWNGTEWDKLAGDIDLSSYYATNAEIDALF